MAFSLQDCSSRFSLQPLAFGLSQFAGDSGEFYTPRAVVRFMVAVTDPRLSETVLDPASGTGGFLVEMAA